MAMVWERDITPYCGAPPSPETLWTRWNFDPLLIAVLVVLIALFGVGASRLEHQRRGIAKSRQAAFYVGWAIAAAALISPLCALSVSLFAARVGQHMILTLIAAPLVAAGRPGIALAGLMTNGAGWPRRFSSARLPAAALFTVLLWFWHSPAPYAATFASTLVYWSMHLSLFGSALWLWSGLLATTSRKALPATGAAVISSVQMGFLGALITFAPRPVYTPHFLTTEAWGLTSLQDQQLGGAIMWIPGCVIFFVVSIAMLRFVLATAACSTTAAWHRRAPGTNGTAGSAPHPAS